LTFGTLKRAQREKHLLTTHLTLGSIQLQSKELLRVVQYAIVGAGNIQYMPVVLKALNVRNVVVLTEQRTTGS